ncbi:hypothetical protein AZE42_06614 [Rhizopogon vesiculosus]|uniref:Uncharacterized protein n=1 Tax=Rhizopogon vesiculosus TaxID=180088 RepID=A0A1J8QDS2_9AGAM|nr:hypothetical protein AZE42_06614 [Rhizopogon vesiculosus]
MDVGKLQGSSSVLAPLVGTSHSRIEQNLNIAPGHDIARDFFDHGIDVTIDQRLLWSHFKQ